MPEAQELPRKEEPKNVFELWQILGQYLESKRVWIVGITEWLIDAAQKHGYEITDEHTLTLQVVVVIGFLMGESINPLKPKGLITRGPSGEPPKLKPKNSMQALITAAAFVALLIFGSIAFGQQPEISVTPPNNQCIASCNIQDGRGYSWFILANDFTPVIPQKMEGGKRVAFEVKQGTRYFIRVTILTASGTLDDAQTFYSPDGPDPGPDPPNPGPDPPNPPDPPEPDEPDLPDGRFGFAKLAWDGAMAVDSSLRGPAGSLSTAYGVTSSTIAAGSYDQVPGGETKKMEAAMKDHKERLQEVWEKYDEKTANAWIGWENSLVEALDTAWIDGKLKTVKDLGIAYQEVSKGLGEVRLPSTSKSFRNLFSESPSRSTDRVLERVGTHIVSCPDVDTFDTVKRVLDRHNIVTSSIRVNYGSPRAKIMPLSNGESTIVWVFGNDQDEIFSQFSSLMSQLEIY